MDTSESEKRKIENCILILKEDRKIRQLTETEQIILHIFEELV